MDEEKIEWVKKELGDKTVQELAEFDVKKGQDGEDGEPYYKTYLDQTTASMGALFKKTKWAELTPWEKLCCYKISGSAGVDCDASLHSTVIYQLAFFGYDDPVKVAPYPPQKPKTGLYCLESNAGILRGDTMNSYATTVREFLRTYGHEKHCVEGFLEKAGKKWRTSKQYGESDARWEICVLDHYDYFEGSLPKEAQKFFELYHTVGNFLPAPRGFNNSRGGYPFCDYWDMALMCSYHYYSGIKYPLNWIAEPDKPATFYKSRPYCLPENSIPDCHQWLDSFGTWNGFVEQNFLQDFIGPDGTPKELWKGHFTNGTMPRKAADFEQFFTNASAWIAERGERIARAVKAALAAEKSAAAREAHP